METVLKNSLSKKGHCELTKTCVPKQEQALCKKTINNVISGMYINAGNLKKAKAWLDDERWNIDKSSITKKGKYTDEVMNAVRQHIGLNEDDESMNDTIMNMSKAEVFTRYCQWNGLLGSWYHTLLDIIEDIYDITLETKEPK